MPMYTVYLGAAPADEPCVQPRDPRFYEKNLSECAAYILAVRRFCGEPPAGANLYAKLGEYDFGPAREVVIEFDTEDEAACHYAQVCEETGPRTWAAVGMEPPRLAGGRGL